MSRRVGAIVLAAGGSRRLGRPKMLLELGGRTLLARAVAPHLEVGLDPVVVVLGHRAADVRASGGLPDDPRLRVVVNDRWAEGMASSIRCGLEAAGDVDAVLIALADQPDLDAARVRAVVVAWDAAAPVVVPVGEDHPVHPVLFARRVLGELMCLQGDVGGRAVVDRHWASAIRVPMPALLDVDTEEDYRVARARHDGGESDARTPHRRDKLA